MASLFNYNLKIEILPGVSTSTLGNRLSYIYYALLYSGSCIYYCTSTFSLIMNLYSAHEMEIEARQKDLHYETSEALMWFF
jgi:hypothetical protein